MVGGGRRSPPPPKDRGGGKGGSMKEALGVRGGGKGGSTKETTPSRREGVARRSSRSSEAPALILELIGMEVLEPLDSESHDHWVSKGRRNILSCDGYDESIEEDVTQEGMDGEDPNKEEMANEGMDGGAPDDEQMTNYTCITSKVAGDVGAHGEENESITISPEQMNSMEEHLVELTGGVNMIIPLPKLAREEESGTPANTPTAVTRSITEEEEVRNSQICSNGQKMLMASDENGNECNGYALEEASDSNGCMAIMETNKNVHLSNAHSMHGGD